MGQNGQIWLFCTIFYLFPQNEAGIDLEWSIHLIHNFSHLLPPKHLMDEINFHFWRGIHRNFLSFPTFSNRFTPMWLKITHNCKFGLKCGLDWVKTAKFGHFAGFSIFSPKMRLRLTRNGQFYPIHNFSHHFPPNHLISGEIPKIFISRGGVHQANLLSRLH